MGFAAPQASATRAHAQHPPTQQGIVCIKTKGRQVGNKQKTHRGVQPHPQPQPCRLPHRLLKGLIRQGLGQGNEKGLLSV